MWLIFSAPQSDDSFQTFDSLKKDTYLFSCWEFGEKMNTTYVFMMNMSTTQYPVSLAQTGNKGV